MNNAVPGQRENRLLTRRQAQRYVNRRQRRRMRRNIGDLWTLLIQTFILCCFIAFNTRVRETFNQKKHVVEFDEEQK